MALVLFLGGGFFLESKHIGRLTQPYLGRGFGLADHPVGLDGVPLGVDLHFREGVVVLHVPLADVPATLDGFDALRQAITTDDARIDAPLADEGYAGLGDERSEHRSAPDRFDGRDAGVGVAHHGLGDHAALEDQLGLGAERRGPPEDQVRDLADLDAADEVTHALGDGGVDRVLAHVPFDPEVVGPRPLVLRQGTPLSLVLVGGVPGPHDHLAAPAHGLGVAGHHADGAQVVQDVLGRDGLGPDAGLGEGHVLGDVLGQVVADHQHVEVFVQGVPRVRAGRVGRRGQHVLVLDHLDDVRGVTPARTLGVVRVDGPALERRDRGLDEPGLVEGVGVDQALDVVLVAHAQARVDGGRGRAPILVQLQPARPGLAGLAECHGRTVVPLARDAVVHGEAVDRLEHLLHQSLAGRARRRVRPRRWPRAPSQEGGHAARDGLVRLLRTDQVNVRVETAGSHDQAFSGDDVGTVPDDEVLVHARHDVGISCFADTLDHAVLDADVRLVDARPVDDEGVRDDGVENLLVASIASLTHTLAEGLAAAEFAFVAVAGHVFLDTHPQIRSAQANEIPGSRAEHAGIVRSRHRRSVNVRHVASWFGRVGETRRLKFREDVVDTGEVHHTRGQVVATADDLVTG